MDIKFRIINYIIKCQSSIISELGVIQNNVNTLEAKIKKLESNYKNLASSNKKLESLNNKLKHCKIRLHDNLNIKNMIDELNFVPYIPHLIKDLVNPYNCFCDRINFFYDISLENKNDEELIQIFLCEFFNNWQDGFFPYKSLNRNKSKYIENTSVLMMHHIGVIKEQLWYGQEMREFLITKMNRKYDINIISFKPNINAMEYLFKQVLNENDIFGTVNKIQTVEVIEANIYPKYMLCTKYYGIHICNDGDIDEYVNVGLDKYTFFYTVKNNRLKRVTRRTHLVKEHEELINLTKLLSGEII